MKKSSLMLFLCFLWIFAFGFFATINRVSASASFDYVVITTNDVVANSERLEGFIRLKERFGYSVKVVTEADFDGLVGQAPNGRAEKIRQWLINNYESLGIKYVLLIGNPDPADHRNPSDFAGDIPMKLCWTTTDAVGRRLETGNPTDHFYADLTGDWNLDGDLWFGEVMAIDNPPKPDILSDEDTFSIRWTGQLEADYSEKYEFKTEVDDGAKLWIDGDLIFDTSLPPPTPPPWGGNEWTYGFKDPLTAGKHSIRIEYFENVGHAEVKLWWKSEHQTNNGWQIIPKERLFHDGSGGLDAEYYENMDFTNLAGTKIDETINFDWRTGDRGQIGNINGVDFEAEVYVGRIPVYDNDYAQLDLILQKMIKYETEQGDLNWRKKILLPTHPTDKETPGWELHEQIKTDISDPKGFTSYRIYSPCAGTPPPPCEKVPCTEQNVEDEWKNGYGMVTWFTHGWYDSADFVFSTPRCTNLDDTKPSFTFQASCLNARPDFKANLAYSLLKHGAVSTVSATQVSLPASGWATPDPQWGTEQDLAYYYTKNIIADENPAGEALFRAKDLDVDICWWANVLSFNLYGDPACSLFETIVNNPPVAEANGPYISSIGSIITLDASGSYDSEGDEIIKYEWDLDNDGAFEIATQDPIYSFTWSESVIAQTVTLRVTDILGASSTDASDVALFGVELIITPSSLDIVPGNVGTCGITLTNKGNVPDTFDLSLSGLPASWWYEFSSSQVSLGAYESTIISLSIEPYKHWSTSPGDYQFTVTATSQQASNYGLIVTDSKAGNVHVLPFYEVEISLAPNTMSVQPSQTALYTIEITNLGNVQDTFDISLIFHDFDGTYRVFPTSIQVAWTSLDQPTITLLPGGSDTATLTVAVPSDWAGIEDAIYGFTATATSVADLTASDSESAELTVQATKESMARYIDLELQALINLVSSSTIDETIKASLLDKLTSSVLRKEQALNYILQRKAKLSSNMLEACKEVLKAFINLVDAQYNKYIPEATGNEWISMAQTIINDITATISTPI